MDSRVNRITAEIAAVIERNLRLELLREREAMLEKELEAVRRELGRPSHAVRVRRPVRRPAVSVAQPVHKPAASKQTRGASARALIIQTLRRSGRPMTIRELTKAITRKGWKSNRKDPSKTVDVALRHNPRDFRRTAPGTFALNR